MEKLNQDNFIKRLENHPRLKSRFKSILDLAENTTGDFIKADEAEPQAIEEVRQLGHEILPDWAIGRTETSVNELKKSEKNVKGNGKKKIARSRHLVILRCRNVYL